jgi:hypothetical protein
LDRDFARPDAKIFSSICALLAKRDFGEDSVAPLVHR